MTPAARYAAAIDILDRVMAGAPAERELTVWARGNRFAGSKDRAAIRDIVYDGLRNLRSYAHRSGLKGARGVLVGRLMTLGEKVTSIFNGEGYAPDPITVEEADVIDAAKAKPSRAIALDIPDWLESEFSGTDDYSLLKSRAPIDLRVNVKKTTLEKAAASLKKEGIETDPLDLVPTALRVRGETRKIPQSAMYLNGSVELQDAGSQALVACLDIPTGGSVLDYCAGGGGKSLAIAALADPKTAFSAYDLDASRLKAIKDRATRSGAKIKLLSRDPVKTKERYDLVVLDVPCSGSGSWRRSPDAKWKLTQDRLEELTKIQADILETTAPLVSTSGALAYMTCSLFEKENQNQISAFLKQNSGWKVTKTKQFRLDQACDGFFISVLRRTQP